MGPILKSWRNFISMISELDPYKKYVHNKKYNNHFEKLKGTNVTLYILAVFDWKYKKSSLVLI